MVSFSTELLDTGKIIIVPSSYPQTKDEALASLIALKNYEISGQKVFLDDKYIETLENLIK